MRHQGFQVQLNQGRFPIHPKQPIAHEWKSLLCHANTVSPPKKNKPDTHNKSACRESASALISDELELLKMKVGEFHQ
jgi:hypothetical protein